MHLTARDNKKLGIVDDVIDEPLGGAHRDPQLASEHLQNWVLDQLQDLDALTPDELVDARYERFRKLGEYAEDLTEAAS